MLVGITCKSSYLVGWRLLTSFDRYVGCTRYRFVIIADFLQNPLHQGRPSQLPAGPRLWSTIYTTRYWQETSIDGNTGMHYWHVCAVTIPPCSVYMYSLMQLVIMFVSIYMSGGVKCIANLFVMLAEFMHQAKQHVQIIFMPQWVHPQSTSRTQRQSALTPP